MGRFGCWQLMHSGRSIVARVFTLLLALNFTVPAEAGVNRWTRGGDGNVVRALVVDPSSSSTLYAGSSGGVYKSINHGESYRRVLQDIGVISSLAIDPQVPSTLYAGSSDGVWKSVDSGASWNRADTDLPGGGVQALVIDPSKPLTLYGGLVDGGVWKSVDGGMRWSRAGELLRDLFVMALAIDPENPETLYAGTSDGQVWKSIDGGGSWSEVLRDVEPVRALAIDPATPATVFAGTSGGVWRTTDGGQSWNRTGDEQLPVLALTIDSSTSTLWAVTDGRGLWKTTDGGDVWIFFWDQTELSAFAVDPQQSPYLYAGTRDRWVWRSRDGGSQWQVVGDGLPTSRFNDFFVDPSAPGEVYASSYDLGTLVSRDHGVTWAVYQADGTHALVVDPLDSMTVYAVGIVYVLKSLDGGATWERILTTARPDPIFVLDPETPTKLYVGLERGGVLRSQDGGATWEGVLSLFPPVNSMALDPQTPTTLYVGNQQGGLWKSTDGGDHWENVSPFVAQGFLVIDPSTPSTLYSQSGSVGRIAKSVDGGVTWNDIGRGLGDLAVRSLAIDPEQPTTLWGATRDGVYRSIDGGESWFRSGRGLEGTLVYQVEVDPIRPGVLYAGTESGVLVMEEATQLELQDERFEVEVFWQDFQDLRGAGAVALLPETMDIRPVPLRSQDSAVLEFFSPDNWELLIKVLDGRSLNGRFWVFYAAATDVEVTLTVTDTSCGDVQIYQNALGQPAPAVTDTDAFEGCESPTPPDCVADEDTLCLGEDGRFQVELDWRDFDGQPGAAREVLVPPGALATNDDSGLFYFFSEDNWELLVKVLDGCAFNSSYWIFAAATTDVGYSLRVTDRMTGEVQEYANPLGIASPAITDTAAFSCDPDE